MDKIPCKNVCSSPGSDACSRRNQATIMRCNTKYEYILYEFVSTKRIEFVVCGYGLFTKNNQNKKVFDSILKKINALFLMNLAVSISVNLGYHLKECSLPFEIDGLVGFTLVFT